MIPVYHCSRCGDEIHDGDRFHNYGKGRLCTYCLKDMTALEYIELVGEEIEQAVYKEPYYVAA